MLADAIFFICFTHLINHPIYRQVEYRELKNKVIYPEEVKNILNKNITLVLQILLENTKGVILC